MQRNRLIKNIRVFRNNWYQIIYEFRRTDENGLLKIFEAPFIRQRDYSLSLKILRIIYSIPAFIKSYYYEDLPMPCSMPNPEDFEISKKGYWNIPELFKRYGVDINIFNLTKEEIRIFNNRNI